jgi:homoserine O-acetyltransferase
MTALALRRAPSSEGEDATVAIPSGFRLASGDTLTDRSIQLRLFGARRGPQVLALGGISAGRDVCGEAGWWRETLVEHEAVDLNRFGLIGIDFAPLNDERVRMTPFDQARLLEIALDGLGIEQLHGFVGASYGGMIGLALAAIAPRRVRRLCVISAAHRPTAQALAWRGIQRRIVEFGLAQGAGAEGLALARQLGMVTYRTAEEFEARFGAGVDETGRGAVDRYLENRGAAYSQIALPRRWLSLSEAIDRFEVDPASVAVPATLIATREDQLAPLSSMKELAARLPDLRRFEILSSLYGHDAFLKEPAHIGPVIRQFLEDASHG